MKKIKLLMPLLGVAATAGLVLPAAVSCGNGQQQETTYKVSLSSDSEGIEPIDVTEIKEKTELVVTLKFKTGYKAFVATPTATVGESAVASTFKETATGGTLTIAADLITGDVVITAIATDETVAGIVNNTVEYDLADSGITSLNCDKTVVTQDDLDAGYIVMNFSISNPNYLIAFGLTGEDIALSYEGLETPVVLSLYNGTTGDYAFTYNNGQSITVAIYGTDKVAGVFADAEGKTVNIDLVFGINKLQYGLHFINGADYETDISGKLIEVDVYDLFAGVEKRELINSFKGGEIKNAYVDAENVLDEYQVEIHYNPQSIQITPTINPIYPAYGPLVTTGIGTMLAQYADFLCETGIETETDHYISFRFNPEELMLVDMYMFFDFTV